MWGGQYQIYWFLLYFDHRLHFSDILKKATGPKPDVTLVSFMRRAKDGIETWEKKTGIGA